MDDDLLLAFNELENEREIKVEINAECLGKTNIEKGNRKSDISKIQSNQSTKKANYNISNSPINNSDDNINKENKVKVLNKFVNTAGEIFLPTADTSLIEAEVDEEMNMGIENNSKSSTSLSSLGNNMKAAAKTQPFGVKQTTQTTTSTTGTMSAGHSGTTGLASKPAGLTGIGIGAKPAGATGLAPKPAGATGLGIGAKPAGATGIGIGAKPAGATGLAPKPAGATGLGIGAKPAGVTGLAPKPAGATGLGIGAKPAITAVGPKLAGAESEAKPTGLTGLASKPAVSIGAKPPAPAGTTGLTSKPAGTMAKPAAPATGLATGNKAAAPAAGAGATQKPAVPFGGNSFSKAAGSSPFGSASKKTFEAKKEETRDTKKTFGSFGSKKEETKIVLKRENDEHGNSVVVLGAGDFEEYDRNFSKASKPGISTSKPSSFGKGSFGSKTPTSAAPTTAATQQAKATWKGGTFGNKATPFGGKNSG